MSHRVTAAVAAQALALLLVVALCLLPLPAHAQIAGGKPIRLVIPFGTGGAPDILARLLAPKLADSLGQPVLVDNKPGATGIIAAENVMKSPADGTSLFVADSAHVGINPNIRAKLPYDPQKDFVPVIEMVSSMIFVAVGAGVPVTNLQELVAFSKTRPDGLSYGSSGSGTPHHLSMELIRLETGAKLVHVPFKGVAQSIPALLAGDIAAVTSGPGALLGHVKAGKARLIAAINPVRWSRMPDVPSFADAGIPALDVTIGLLAPAGTPAETVRRLNAEFVKALRAPDIADKLVDTGLEVIAGSPEQFAQSISRQRDSYGELVKASGAKVD